MFIRGPQAYSRRLSQASFHQPCLNLLKEKMIGYRLNGSDKKVLSNVDYTLDPSLDEKLKMRHINQASVALRALKFMVSLTAGALFFKKISEWNDKSESKG
jgi:hypothetical protein